METRKEKAKELFFQGFGCAQSVFTAYADIYGIDRDTALRMSSSFGAGMGRMREVCGAVSGMFMVAGLETGATEGRDQETKMHNYATVQNMAARFKEKSGGSIICRELLGLKEVDGSFVPEKRTNEYYKKRPCISMIENACDIIEETFFSNKEAER